MSIQEKTLAKDEGSYPTTGDHDYAEETECVLEESDVPCGEIYYNTKTFVLKLCCSYCCNIMDSIQQFCDHLSQHINEQASSSQDGEDVLESFESCRTIENSDLELGFDDIGMIIEELDEAEEIAAEVEEEIQQELQRDGDSNSCDFQSFPEESEKFQGFVSIDPPDSERSLVHTEESFDDFDRIIPSMPVPVKKKKKVTHVKVIALKNRVAELYEKINSELAKRSEDIKIDDKSEEAADDIPVSEQEMNKIAGEIGLSCKIVGQTVITHIPEGAKLLDNAPKAPTNIFNNPCVCPACGLTFRSPFSLTIHKRTHYLESKNDIKLAHKCSDCDELFNKISDLKTHIQEKHYPDGFICKICSRKLTSLNLLEKHMRKVHLPRPFSCLVCKKSFSNRNLLDLHMDSHVEYDRKHKCNICGRKYSTENVLLQHKRRHKVPIMQTCVVCGKKTLRITQHMKAHVPRPKRMIPCKICDKTFSFSSSLSQHYKIVHNGSDVGNVEKENTASPTTNNKHMRRTRAQGNASNKREDELEAEQVYQKEEEAKRVIVEIIQNSNSKYKSVFPDSSYCGESELMIPIAREETITAVNSIVNDSDS